MKSFREVGGMAASLPTPVPDQAPHFITDVARVCGIEVAEKLQREFQGLQLYVPANPLPHRKLCTLIGLEAAQAIAKEVGGGAVDIPQGVFRQATVRRALIKRLAGEGTSVLNMARAAECTVRRVYMILQSLREEGGL